MAKQIKYREATRSDLIKGVNALGEAVASTLGPKGMNVALDMGWDQPKVVHDGVTVADEIELSDPFENMGAQLVKGAAQRTNDVAGDGTTTATILTQSIVNSGMKHIRGSWFRKGSNGMIMKVGIEIATDLVVNELKKLAKPIKRSEYIKVATISAQNKKIGMIIAEAIEKVGRDGVITVEEGTAFETELEIKEGMDFDRGFITPYFMTDIDKREATIKDAYILLIDFRIYSSTDLIPFLETFVETSRNIVIIAESIEGEALQFLVTNRIEGKLNVLAIKTPGFGDRQKDWLRDIATLTGATVISEDTGKDIKKVTMEDLGRARRVTSDKKSTIIVAGGGKKKEIKKRIKQLNTDIKNAPNDFEKKNVQERLAKMTGGVAVITVGATTQVEMRENKERIIDAVNATQSAIEEGIVPGGEVALWYSGLILIDEIEIQRNRDIKVGMVIVLESLIKPLEILLSNGGYNIDSAIRDIRIAMEKVEEPWNIGFDVMDGRVKDMIKAGIIDPVKVTRSALQNAASVAGIILTTSVLVGPEKGKK